MRTIFLLLFSNIFMTFAWYGHLKHQHVPLWKAILISWGIAFFEYCLQVPANRLGYTTGFSAFQLKIIQEAITLVVFVAFSIWYLQEPFHWKYIISCVFLMGAVYFAFIK
ncbi:MAG: DMT family protein [Chitinophagaceae bacterium]|nr:DMT family protein [Chitinophagaceae bacterium]